MGPPGDEVMSMVPLVRESTYDLLAAMDPSWFGMDLQQSEPPAGAVEAQVRGRSGDWYLTSHLPG
jgi:hypothetical protein